MQFRRYSSAGLPFGHGSIFNKRSESDPFDIVNTVDTMRPNPQKSQNP
jgi:hypothetical protein